MRKSPISRGLAVVGLAFVCFAGVPLTQVRSGTPAPSINLAANTGRRLVLTIGIDKYDEWPKLGTAVSDAQGLVALLFASGFQPLVPAIVDGNATKTRILDLLENQLPRVLAEDDDLVILFAGHGTSREATVGGRPLSYGYLIPVEAPAPANELWSEYLPLGHVLEVIGSLPPRHILVILDSCRSGVALGRVVDGAQGTTGSTASSRVSRHIITSADFKQDALDSGPIPGHSLFTGILLNGLRSGEAFPDRGDRVTDAELAQFVRRRVVTASKSQQTPGSGRFNNDDFGEMVFEKPDPAKLPAQPPPPVYPASAPQLTRGAAAAPRRSRLAVVLGADDYRALPRLRYAVADARGIASALEGLGYDVRIGTNLTLMQLRELLEDVARRASSDLGSVVFFYAGHGFQFRGEDYLALVDTEIARPQLTALPFRLVQDILSAAGADQKIFLLDTTLATLDASSSRDLQLLREPSLRPDRGFGLLKADAANWAMESEALGHGVFSYFTIQGLRGAAADPDGVITFASLAEYVSRSVAAYSGDAGRTQRPSFVVGGSTGSFPIGVVTPRR